MCKPIRKAEPQNEILKFYFSSTKREIQKGMVIFLFLQNNNKVIVFILKLATLVWKKTMYAKAYYAFLNIIFYLAVKLH